MSATGAQKPAAGSVPAASWMHSYPPVFSGAAAASGLNARAAANKPVPASAVPASAVPASAVPASAVLVNRAMVPDMFFPSVVRYKPKLQTCKSLGGEAIREVTEPWPTGAVAVTRACARPATRRANPPQPVRRIPRTTTGPRVRRALRAGSPPPRPRRHRRPRTSAARC